MKNIKRFLIVIFILATAAASNSFAMMQDVTFKGDANVNRFIVELLREQRLSENKKQTKQTKQKKKLILNHQLVQDSKEVNHERTHTNS